jgi:hypothetical protein
MKEAVVAYFQAILWNLLGATEKSYKAISQNSLYPVGNINLGMPEHAATVIPTFPSNFLFCFLLFTQTRNFFAWTQE